VTFIIEKSVQFFKTATGQVAGNHQAPQMLWNVTYLTINTNSPQSSHLRTRAQRRNVLGDDLYNLFTHKRTRISVRYEVFDLVVPFAQIFQVTAGI
jgi:hypothetical protein